MTKLTKTDDGYEVVCDGRILGVVRLKATTKTGFRNHRCIGQVPCKRWFAYDAAGNNVTGSYGLDRGQPTRKHAVERLKAVAGETP